MRIEFENYDEKVIFESERNDFTTDEVLTVVKGLMVTLTWQESSIIDGMKTLVKEYE